MNKGKVEASSRINAPAKRVYAIIADYRVGHPAILPKKYFRKLEIEAGGTGAGTRIKVEMKVMGTTRTFRQVVSEPEPGRILVESDPDGSTVTKFTVDRIGDGSTCNVKFETMFSVRNGLAGAIEKFFISSMLRKIYIKELAILADYAVNNEDR